MRNSYKKTTTNKQTKNKTKKQKQTPPQHFHRFRLIKKWHSNAVKTSSQLYLFQFKKGDCSVGLPRKGGSVSSILRITGTLLFSRLGIYIYHHHHVALVARISLTLSRHSSLSFIAPGRSSGQHPVSLHSCWMYFRAGRPAFARPCVGVHKSTSLMSSSLLLQQCPACLVRLTWIVFVIGGRWPYSWCLVGCYRQDLFKIARSIVWNEQPQA